MRLWGHLTETMGSTRGTWKALWQNRMVEAKPCWECRKNLREKDQPEAQLQPVSAEEELPSLPDPRSCRAEQRNAIKVGEATREEATSPLLMRRTSQCLITSALGIWGVVRDYLS